MLNLSHQFYRHISHNNKLNKPIFNINIKEHEMKYKNGYNSLFDNNGLDDYDEDEISDEFGREIEEMMKKQNKPTHGEIGIRIFYPVGQKPDILKTHLEETENELNNKKSKNFELIFFFDLNSNTMTR